MRAMNASKDFSIAKGVFLAGLPKGATSLSL